MLLTILFTSILVAALLAYRADLKRGFDFESRNEAMRRVLGDYAAPQHDKYLSEAYKLRYRQTQTIQTTTGGK